LILNYIFVTILDINEEYDAILTRLNNIEENIKQNQIILESIQRRARLSILFSSLKWFIILGLTFGTFYYTKPYLEELMKVYSQVSDIGTFLK
jgi:hypothetical protein